ncbi:MAG: hypothetical protein J1E36_05960 [Eubacterium sp.]|nr:hypothetical protein [Eubacterium sp.]
MSDYEPSVSSVLSDLVMAFICPRGEFYPNKNYGSQIKRNKNLIDEDKLLSFARQAVSDMDGVYVKSTQLNDSNAVFTVMINDESRQVSIEI